MTTVQDSAQQDRPAAQRFGFIQRARARIEWWSAELAAERWEEFRPEMRRRILCEEDFIADLESGIPILPAIRTYQLAAIHRGLQGSVKTKAQQNIERKLTEIVESQRRLTAELRALPKNRTGRWKEIFTELDDLDRYAAELKGAYQSRSS